MNQASEADQSIKVVYECVGLRARKRVFCQVLSNALAGRALLLLALVNPVATAQLLQPCTLQQADYVLVKLLDGRHYLLRVRRISVEHTGLLQKVLGHRGALDRSDKELRGFKLFLRSYIYTPATGTFEPVPRMPHHLPGQIRQALMALQQIDSAGADWRSFNAPQQHLRKEMLHLYGIKGPLLSRGSLVVVSGVTHYCWMLVFLIQELEQVYLIYRGQYFYPVLIQVFGVPALVGMVKTLSELNGKVMGIMNARRLTPTVQGKWVRAIASNKLIPGDVIVLQPGRALCDMVLLRGACLVTESMLSGEAAQVRKNGYVPEPDVNYQPDVHNYCSVYAGTMVQQVWNPENPEEEVLAMVCRTGMNTALGVMIRQLVTPTSKRIEKDPVLPDIARLGLFALALQCLLLIPYAVMARVHKPDARHIWWRTLDLVIYALPPGLPLVVLNMGSVARKRLKDIGLTLINPSILKLGAAIDIVCFDKTGTLTASTAHLHGVLPVHRAAFTSLQQSALRWSNRLKQACAVCHSLNMVSKSVVAGVDMERALFKAVEARFLDRETIVLPHTPDTLSPARAVRLSMVRVFEFSSHSLRSGAVVIPSDVSDGSGLLFLRGAPGVIRSLVRQESVPPDFDEVVDQYSSDSFRLLALAVGVIPDVHKVDLLRLTQKQVEVCAMPLDLLSLVVLTNSVREDSKETIRQVQDGGGVRTMMITGDYHHTAIAVAKDVGMVKPGRETVVIDTTQQQQVQPKSSPMGSQSAVTAAAPSNNVLPWGVDPQVALGGTTQYSDDGQYQQQVMTPASEKVVKQVSWAGGHKAQLQRRPDAAAPHQATSSAYHASRQSILGPRQMFATSSFDSEPSMTMSNHAGPPMPSPLALPPAQPQAGGRARGPLEGLRFQMAGGHCLDASEVVNALAEGQMQCAVTGDALEALLQQHDLSLLETVLRNAMVFSRMKPHQKGQVMDLLGVNGIHQLINGRLRYIPGMGMTTMFCGDGINDLPALAAADVGMAIGATDAVIAATLSTSKASIAGVSSFLRISKGAHAIYISLFKYMVVYQCIVAEANTAAFVLDGSSLSNLQSGIIDLQAMAMALAACWVAPLHHMTQHKPPATACTFSSFTLLVSMAACLLLSQTLQMVLLFTWPGFTGGTGTAYLNPVITVAWLMADLQLLAPLVSITPEISKFCAPLIRTKAFAAFAVMNMLSSCMLVIVKMDRLGLLSLYNFPQSFRNHFAGVATAGLFIYIIVVQVIRRALNEWEQRKVAAM